MDQDLKEQQQRCDRSWTKILAAQKEHLGNLQTNLDFLNEVELLKPDSNILEIGCGIGTIVHELSQKGHSIIGSDISTQAIEYGRRKYPSLQLQIQAAETLPYDDNTFDFVLSFDLLEHIAQVDKHISEVRRVLKPNGYYLLQTPNKYSNIIFETMVKKSLKWRQFHPSLHTPGQLKRRMRKHGFEMNFVKMDPINEFTVKKLKKLGLIGSFIKRINFRRMPISLQTNLYVIAHKTEK